MAWNISKAKRQALVKLQLRDKNGRFIEMGGGVKWYSSKLKREVGGTVVDYKGQNAIVQMNDAFGKPTSGPPVPVPAHMLEVVDAKASLDAPEAPSAVDTPEFEAPEAVAKIAPEAAEAPSAPALTVAKTPDGNTYITAPEGAELYTSAKELAVGDEVIAPDGAHPQKPFSMGKGWAYKSAERVPTEGPKIGKVLSIKEHAYAVVQLPEGETVESTQKPGEQVNTVTIGLSNKVIKATPELKEALKDVIPEPVYAAPEAPAVSQDDEKTAKRLDMLKKAPAGTTVTAKDGSEEFEKSEQGIWQAADGSVWTPEDIAATVGKANAAQPEGYGSAYTIEMPTGTVFGDTKPAPEKSYAEIAGPEFAAKLAEEPTFKYGLSNKDEEFGGFDAYNPAERASLEDYVGSSVMANSALRLGGDVSSMTAQTIAGMDSILDRSVLTGDAKVYRGLGANQAMLDGILAKGVMRDRAFTSTSVDKDFADSWVANTGSSAMTPIIMEINLPKGFKAHKVDYDAVGPGFDHENEVVLPRGLEFDITDVQEYTNASGQKGYRVQATPILNEKNYDQTIGASNDSGSTTDPAGGDTSTPAPAESAPEASAGDGFEQGGQVRDSAGSGPDSQPGGSGDASPAEPSTEADNGSGGSVTPPVDEAAAPSPRRNRETIMAELQPLDTANWKKVGGQAGSNPGGVFEDEKGQKWYVKQSKSEAHARAEVLSDQLYKAAGIDASGLKLTTFNGKMGTASPMIDGAKTDLGSKYGDKAYMDKIREGFAVDAWLANWDVLGLEDDNIVTDANGNPIRIDTGGTMMFRAQGGIKNDQQPGAWGNEVKDWDGLRTKGTAQKVFGSMSDQELADSAKRVEAVTPEEIDAMVDALGFKEPEASELKDTLKARREDIIKKASALSGASSDPSDEPFEPVLPSASKPKVTYPKATKENPNVLQGYTIDKNENGVYYPTERLSPSAQMGLMKGTIVPENLPFMLRNTKSGDVHYWDTKGVRHWGQYGGAGALTRRKNEKGEYEYLMAQRSSSLSTDPNKWALPGGAHKYKSDAMGNGLTAKMELEEELGIKVHGEPVAGYKHQTAPDWAYDYSVFDAPEGVEPNWDDVDKKEIQDLKWMTAAEIKKLSADNQLQSDMADVLDDLLATSESVQNDEPEASAPEADSVAPDAPSVDAEEAKAPEAPAQELPTVEVEGPSAVMSDGKPAYVGSRVAHEQFGYGTVIQIIAGKSAKIEFDDGVVKISQSHKISSHDKVANPNAVVDTANLTPGESGNNPANGKLFIAGSDKTPIYQGDKVEAMHQGELRTGVVKGLYKTNNALAIIFDGDTKPSTKKAAIVKSLEEAPVAAPNSPEADSNESSAPEAPKYNDSGFTADEQKQVDALEAELFKGWNADTSDKLDELYAKGDARLAGKDVPGDDAAPETPEEVAPEPEKAPESLVEPDPAPEASTEPEATSEPTMEELMAKFAEMNEKAEAEKAKATADAIAQVKAAQDAANAVDEELKSKIDAMVQMKMASVVGSDAELKALDHYTYSGSADLNKRLREGDASILEEDEYVNLMGFMEKQEGLNLPVTVFRGGDLDGNFSGDSVARGTIISDKGFTSTTASKETAENYVKMAESKILFEIRVPAGFKGLYPNGVRPEGHKSALDEFIMPPNTEFRVVSDLDVDGQRHVKLEAIPAKPKAEAPAVSNDEAPALEEATEDSDLQDQADAMVHHSENADPADVEMAKQAALDFLKMQQQLDEEDTADSNEAPEDFTKAHESTGFVESAPSENAKSVPAGSYMPIGDGSSAFVKDENGTWQMFINDFPSSIWGTESQVQDIADNTGAPFKIPSHLREPEPVADGSLTSDDALEALKKKLLGEDGTAQTPQEKASEEALKVLQQKLAEIDDVIAEAEVSDEEDSPEVAKAKAENPDWDTLANWEKELLTAVAADQLDKEYNNQNDADDKAAKANAESQEEKLEDWEIELLNGGSEPDAPEQPLNPEQHTTPDGYKYVKPSDMPQSDWDGLADWEKVLLGQLDGVPKNNYNQVQGTMMVAPSGAELDELFVGAKIVTSDENNDVWTMVTRAQTGFGDSEWEDQDGELATSEEIANGADVKVLSFGEIPDMDEEVDPEISKIKSDVTDLPIGSVLGDPAADNFKKIDDDLWFAYVGDEPAEASSMSDAEVAEFASNYHDFHPVNVTQPSAPDIAGEDDETVAQIKAMPVGTKIGDPDGVFFVKDSQDLWKPKHNPQGLLPKDLDATWVKPHTDQEMADLSDNADEYSLDTVIVPTAPAVTGSDKVAETDVAKLPIGVKLGDPKGQQFEKLAANQWVDHFDGELQDTVTYTDSEMTELVNGTGSFKLDTLVLPEGESLPEEEKTDVGTLGGLSKAEFKKTGVGTKVAYSASGKASEPTGAYEKTGPNEWSYTPEGSESPSKTGLDSDIFDHLFEVDMDNSKYSINNKRTRTAEPVDGPEDTTGVSKGVKVYSDGTLLEGYPVGTTIKPEKANSYYYPNDTFWVKQEDGNWQEFKKTAKKTMKSNTASSAGLSYQIQHASVSQPVSTNHAVLSTGEIAYVGDTVHSAGESFTVKSITKTAINVVDADGVKKVMKPHALQKDMEWGQPQASNMMNQGYGTDPLSDSSKAYKKAQQKKLEAKLEAQKLVKDLEGFSGGSADEYDAQGVSMKSDPNPPEGNGLTVLESSGKVDESDPLYGTPQPVKPSSTFPPFQPPTADTLPKWDSEKWLDKVKQRYLDNPNKAKDTLEQSNKWSAVQAVISGDKSQLDGLVTSMYLDEDLRKEALDGIAAQDHKNSALKKEIIEEAKAAKAEYDQKKAEHSAKLASDQAKYDKDIKDWMKANPNPSAYKKAKKPPVSTQNFEGGGADWTKAHVGTYTAKAVFDSIRDDNVLGSHGLSIATDSDQIEDLDVKVTKVLDTNGDAKFEVKFKLTAPHGKAFELALKGDSKVKADDSEGIFPTHMVKDAASGLMKDSGTPSSGFVNQGTRYSYTDPMTGAKVVFQKSPMSGYNVSSNDNTVKIHMPIDSTPEMYQQTLENLGIKKARPSTQGDIKVLAENKLISLMGTHQGSVKSFDGRINMSGADRKKALDKIEQDYGITTDDMTFRTEPNGRVKLFLDDKKAEALAKKYNVSYFGHHVSGYHDPQRWISMLSGKNTGMLSTYHRFTEGIGGQGSSSTSDMANGAGDYNYITPHGPDGEKPNNNVGVVIKPNSVFKRTDFWANPGDGWGKKAEGGKTSNQSPYKLFDSKGTIGYSGYGNGVYEVLPKDTIPLEDFAYIVVPSGIRDEILKGLQDKGILEVNGFPIDKFVITPGSTPPVDLTTAGAA